MLLGAGSSVSRTTVFSDSEIVMVDRTFWTTLSNNMAPSDPLTLAWVWFSELVRSQVPCHPNFLMIFGKWTHASPRSIWNKFELRLKYIWNTFEHSHSGLVLVHPQLGLLCGVDLPVFCFQEETHPLCFCSLKLCFLHSTKTICNGTTLDRRGLKN